MKEQFSPLSQRLIALGLLVLALLVAFSFVIAPAFSLLQGNLASLRDLRLQVARAEAIRDRPDPPATDEVSTNLYITAPDQVTANEILVGQIASLAARQGLQAQIDQAPDGAGAAPALLSVSFRLAGEQAAVLTFLNDLERSTPLIRFGSLQMIQGNGGAPVPTLRVPQMPIATPSGASPPILAPVPAAPAPPNMAPAVVDGVAATPEQLELQASVIALWGAKK